MTVLSLARQIREAVLSVDAFFWTAHCSDDDVELTITGAGWRATIECPFLENPSLDRTTASADDTLLACRALEVRHRLRVWIARDKLVHDISWNGAHFDMHEFDAASLMEAKTPFLPDCCSRCLHYV